MDERVATSSEDLDHEVASRDVRRCRGERGANLVEYCMLIALIVLASIAGVTAFGRAVPADSFSSVSVAI